MFFKKKKKKKKKTPNLVGWSFGTYKKKKKKIPLNFKIFFLLSPSFLPSFLPNYLSGTFKKKKEGNCFKDLQGRINSTIFFLFLRKTS